MEGGRGIAMSLKLEWDSFQLHSEVMTLPRRMAHPSPSCPVPVVNFKGEVLKDTEEAALPALHVARPVLPSTTRWQHSTCLLPGTVTTD